MVKITPVEGRENEAYLLDGEEVEFERLEQVYKLGFEDNAETVTETWLVTEFGPVLPPAWQYLMSPSSPSSATGLAVSTCPSSRCSGFPRERWLPPE